jgi:hypothetical protein
MEDVKTEDLPPDLQKLDNAGRKAKVEAASKQRAEIQTQIGKLNREREAFLAAERKKQAVAGAETLDQVICKAIRDQAAHQNFKFE